MFRPWLFVLMTAACLPAHAQTHPGPALQIAQTPSMLAGTYSVDGKNVDGSPYRGTALVQQRTDGTFLFLWRIGNFQRGIGTVEGKTVTVDFGDAFPAVYQIEPDGSLSGTWANGKASERLTPLGAQRT
jgi:hypothetical protein